MKIYSIKKIEEELDEELISVEKESKKGNRVVRDLKDLNFSDLIPKKEFGSGLPFVHFTILYAEYRDGRRKSTGVEESIRAEGIKENTSAVDVKDGNPLGKKLPIMEVREVRRKRMEEFREVRRKRMEEFRRNRMN